MGLSKTTIIVLVAAAILIVIAIVFPKTNLFFGRLAFFQNAPVKEQVIEGSLVTYKEAVRYITSAALEAKLIDASQAGGYLKQFESLPADKRITRAEFANLAVRIFNIGDFGYGITLPDVAESDPSSKSIYLFVSNGGLDAEFKPGNFATLTFVAKSAQNLARRFSLR